MAITMTKIAELAGVSQPVVSNVLNNTSKHSRVSEEKRQKILQIVKQYNYRPNAIAKSLVTKKTYNICITIPSAAFFKDFVNTNIITGVQEYLETIDYRVNFASLSTGYKDLNALNNVIADGLIVFYWGLANNIVIKEIQTMDIPFLVVRGKCSMPKVHNIYLDSRKAMFQLTENLIAGGFTKIISAHTYGGDIFHTEGFAGIEQSIDLHKNVQYEKIKIDAFTNLRLETDILINAGKEFLRTFVKSDYKKTAIMFNTDTVAKGALIEAKALGIKVPEDIAITGNGDNHIAHFTEPALTTTDLNCYEYGNKIAETLINLINNKPPQYYKQRWEVKPLYREST